MNSQYPLCRFQRIGHLDKSFHWLVLDLISGSNFNWIGYFLNIGSVVYLLI